MYDAVTVQVALQILGGVFLLIILVIGVGLLVLRRKMKQFGLSLAEMSQFTPPVQLTLIPSDSPNWSDAKNVRRHQDALMLHGFQSEGVFFAEEMSLLIIEGFVHPGRNLLAAIYDHPQGGIVVDIVQKMQDDRTLTVTNTKQGAELDTMPGKSSVRVQDASVDQLLTAWEVDKLSGDSKPAEPGSFKPVFEKAYREEMLWRITKGGPTAEEVHRVAEASGQNVGPEIEEMTRMMQRRQANIQLLEILEDIFLKESGVTAYDWEESIGDRLVIIHDNLTTEELEDNLYIAIEDDGGFEIMDEQGRPTEHGFEIPNMPARDAFAVVNATFPEHRQFKLHWQCEEPIPADFYLEPEEVD